MPRPLMRNVWAKDDAKQARAWRVHVKGGPKNGFEISIVRANNFHGFRSYGWFDRDSKRLIAEDHGEAYLNQDTFNRLIRDAHELANGLNEREGCE